MATSNTQSDFFVVTAGRDRAGEPSHLGSDINEIKVSAKDTKGAFTLMQYHGKTQGGPPLHLHPDQDEMFFVQEGDYEFVCGDQRTALSPGDTIFLPRGIPHTFRQTSASGLLLFMFTPSGDMEAFFKEAGKLQGTPTPEQAAALYAAHGMTVVGPPL